MATIEIRAVPYHLLKVSATNTRYLVNQAGVPVYLSGFHTWGNVQDLGLSDPPSAFDWDEYLAALVSYGCNATELWTHEMEQGWSDNNDIWFVPNRYERTGPGTGYDSKAKYDLTKINSDWLDRLYARAVDCLNNGIYAFVMLFDGWCVGSKGLDGDPFLYHPYRAENNINSVDGDYNDDGEGYEVNTDTNNAAWEYQTDLVEAVIDRLNPLDNIIWTICNEPSGSAAQDAWSNDLIDHIIAYEATKPKQHLIHYSVAYPDGDNTDLDASNAECVSYNATKADTVVDGTKVSIYDTDHTVGLGSEYNWIWTSFCEGHGGGIYMDPWDTNGDTRENATYMLIRANLGYAKTLFAMLNNLLLMTPQAALSTSGYCLARDHATAGEYIAYYDGSSTFNLDLTNATGTLNVRWLRCSDGTVQDSATVSGGDVRTLTPPWTGRVVVYVRHT